MQYRDFRRAIRVMTAQPLYTSINIVGLAIGLAVTILIALFVRDELNYDKFFADSDRIYRIVERFDVPSGAIEAAMTTGQIAPALKAELGDEIEAFVRLYPRQALLTVGDEQFWEDGSHYADDSFFRMFDYNLIEGDLETALDEPNTVVLTESLALKIFGHREIVGETVGYSNLVDLKVTGVMADPPPNTHMNTAMVISMSTLLLLTSPEILDSWTNIPVYTYVKLAEGVTPESLQGTIGNLVDVHVAEIATMLGTNARELVTFDFQPISDIHLTSQREFEIKQNGDIVDVYIFGAVAMFILLIATFNFMNLATARAMKRAREVGVRKASGATRSQIALQFLGEASLMVLPAILVSIALVALLMPWLNSFTGKEVSLDLLAQPELVLGFIGLVVVTTLMAGSYPAVYLSGFRPAAVLKGSSVQGTGAASFRKVLVVAQFSISIGLLIATGVVNSQLEFVQSMDPGFDREHVVVITNVRARDPITQAYETLRTRLEDEPDVIAVTHGTYIPTSRIMSLALYLPEGGDPSHPFEIPEVEVDYDYFETFGIKLLAGRSFDRARGTDKAPDDLELRAKTVAAAIISESNAARLGYRTPQDAIGTRLTELSPQGRGSFPMEIVGVVEDVHFSSAHDQIRPAVFVIDDDSFAYIAVRVTGENLAATLQGIDEIWHEVIPMFPITRNFLDTRFDELYEAETVKSRIFGLFAGLAIFVGCLGLFALAAFMAEQRTKEIGIRKVMGASVPGIVRLLSWEFAKLVLWANLIAWPVAWYLMDSWLSGFAYHVDLNPLLFAGAGILAFAIALLTVAAQSTRAATSRPAGSLRYE